MPSLGPGTALLGCGESRLLRPRLGARLRGWDALLSDTRRRHTALLSGCTTCGAGGAWCRARQHPAGTQSCEGAGGARAGGEKSDSAFILLSGKSGIWLFCQPFLQVDFKYLML